MIRQVVADKVQAAIERLVARGDLPAATYPAPEIIDTKQPEHGDFATNWAMTAVRFSGSQNPRALGELLVAALREDSEFERVEVAGPGFVNLTLTSAAVRSQLVAVTGSEGKSVLSDPDHFARPSASPATSLKINIEYVSVNPNGPITIGSGRGAAYGSTLANVLQAAGHEVHREYYINDGVNSEQMRLFAESVKAICEGRAVPENGYKGDYVIDVAGEIQNIGVVAAGAGKEEQNSSVREVSLHEARRLANLTSKELGKTIIELGFAGEREVLHARAQEAGIPFVDLDRVNIADEALKSVSPELASKLGVMPVKKEGSVLWLAMSDIGNLEVLDAVRDATRLMVKPAAATRAAISQAHEKHYGRDIESTSSGIGSLAWFQGLSQTIMLKKQRQDLAAFGVTFDTWFSEQSLHDSGKVAECIAKLEAKGVADEEPVRTKVKFAKGGDVVEVEREVQAGLVDEEDGHGDAGGQQSAVGGSEADDPQSEIPSPQSEIRNPQSEIRDPQSEIRNPKSATLWLRSSLFGDDMDRVLRRKDGRLTYIASDVAYHEDKFNRPANADKLITVLGPDHHGYIGRLHAVVAADLMGSETPSLDSDDRAAGSGEGAGGGEWASDAERTLYNDDLAFRDVCLMAKEESDKKLEVLIFQLVRFVKDGKPAPMRKRDGNIYALIDLVNEIGAMVKPDGTTEAKQEAGKDVARFFYLMRNHDTTFDFDLDLAAKQSDENPVFYVQYAHARICGVLRKAEEAGIAPAPETPTTPVELHSKERALILKILDLSYEIKRCTEDYSVNRLTTYATELARTYHGFYDACRVIDPDNPGSTSQRLAICRAAKTALKATFDLLGVSAPEKM